MKEPRLIYRRCLRGPEAVLHIDNLIAAQRGGVQEIQLALCPFTGITFALHRIGATVQRVTRADMREAWALIVDHTVPADA